MIDVLAKAVRSGGAVARDYFLKEAGLEVVSRGELDVSRRADLAVEDAVLEVLKAELSGATLLSEERGWVKWGDGELTLVLDPLDGSGNFALGIPYFAVMIAAGFRAESISQLTHAAIYFPVTDTLYTADPERGVLRNGSTLRLRASEDVVFVELGKSFSLEAVDAPRRLGYKVKSSGCAGCSILTTALGISKGFIDIRGRLGVWDVAAPLVFGKYNPRFSYWIDVDRISTKRVRIVAGLGDFVKKVLPLLNLDI